MAIKLGDEVSLQIAVETTARKIMFILLSITLRRMVVGRKSRSLSSWWRIPPLTAVIVVLLPSHMLLRGFTVRHVGIYGSVDLPARRCVRTSGRSGCQGELGDLEFAAVRGPGGLGGKRQIRWIAGIRVLGVRPP